jgi:hypothetical protein
VIPPDAGEICLWAGGAFALTLLALAVPVAILVTQPAAGSAVACVTRAELAPAHPAALLACGRGLVR